jgi:hypothetical protein
LNKKIIAIFGLLLCWAVYDKLVKGADSFPVNLVVFFFCSIYCFILFVLWDWRKKEGNEFDKTVLIIASLPVMLRIVLNLLAINQDRDVYNSLVSNEYIDYFSWLTLIIILIIASWRKFIA